MNMDFKRKLIIPQEIKEMYPVSEEGVLAKAANDKQIADIFTGKSDKLLLVIGPCSADREDAVQSALEKAWRGRFLLRQEQYMETWLTRILINECYAIMRRSRRIIPMAEVGENQPAQWEAQNADEMLCRALTALPDTLRLPIVLHYMEGMDIRTIARTLRIRESAVKSRLHRGREKLRQSDELKELVEDE